MWCWNLRGIELQAKSDAHSFRLFSIVKLDLIFISLEAKIAYEHA